MNRVIIYYHFLIEPRYKEICNTVLEIVPASQGPVYGAIADGINKNDTFYRAIGPFITCVQFIGLMPITGILGKNATCLRYTLLFAYP